MKWFRDEILVGLLDWEFKKLITPSIIRVVYFLGCLFAVVLSINYIVVGFRVNEIIGVFHILLSMLVFAIYILIFRIILEILMALFKGATAGIRPDADTTEIKETHTENVDVPSVPNE